MLYLLPPVLAHSINSGSVSFMAAFHPIRVILEPSSSISLTLQGAPHSSGLAIEWTRSSADSIASPNSRWLTYLSLLPPSSPLFSPPFYFSPLGLCNGFLTGFSASICVFFFFFSLGPHRQHMEVPRLGVEKELQLLAHTTATTMPDLSYVCHLHHSS